MPLAIPPGKYNHIFLSLGKGVEGMSSIIKKVDAATLLTH